RALCPAWGRPEEGSVPPTPSSRPSCPRVAFLTWAVSLTSCVLPCPSPEPKAVFAKEQPARREVQAEAGASATLSCEVAQAQTEVTWYKDGKKLSASSKVRVEAAGCTRRLLVQQAGQADAGEYSCEAGGQRLSFRLHVAGECFGMANPPHLELMATLHGP
uniref:Obscurin, cytoskeletal calmodulin and titin-interacting RhoGEF n=1 Tax=Aotus nancymaae TaxID=37293 RepID=A0A2K5CU56_AOTNA